MSENKYTMRGMMHGEEKKTYQFSIFYETGSKVITTKVEMSSDILSKGLAFAFSGLPMSEEGINNYLDDIKYKVKTIRENS